MRFTARLRSCPFKTGLLPQVVRAPEILRALNSPTFLPHPNSDVALILSVAFRFTICFSPPRQEKGFDGQRILCGDEWLAGAYPGAGYGSRQPFKPADAGLSCGAGVLPLGAAGARRRGLATGADGEQLRAAGRRPAEYGPGRAAADRQCAGSRRRRTGILPGADCQRAALYPRRQLPSFSNRNISDGQG